MEISILNPVIDQRWLSFISENSESNIFHHPAWLNVLQNQYEYKPAAVCLLDNTGNIAAGIPFCELTSFSRKKKWLSLPFSDFSTPLYRRPEDLSLLISGLIDLSKQQKICSIEVGSFLTNDGSFCSHHEAYVHTIDVEPDEDKMMKAFDRTRRQGIAKSIKEGLTAEISSDAAAIERFYELHLMTRKKLGVPIQPKGFFYEIKNEIFSKDLGFILFIKKDNIDLAAGFFMGFNRMLTYKYNASNPELLQYRPNNLIIWEALREAIKKGYKKFDFGKTDLDNEGLRKFKLGWAAKETSLYYSFYPAVPQHELLGRIKDKVVSPLIKSSPEFVCKIIGEVAYKHFPAF